MTDFNALEALFFAARDKPLAERAGFLDEACRDDAGLRARIERLLAGPPKAAGFLDGLTGPRSENATAEFLERAERIGSVLVGKYKLVEVIGEGGMGSVWLALQSEPVKRKVAVKVIKPGMDSKMVLARFEAERQALALMDHPNIAKVLDGGLTPDGRPFFVMELVKGVPITEYCDACRLAPRARLELFIPICQAIQHAHQKGVIHRDLKPSNVLIALYDDRPVPKVIDFGVAKATGAQLTEHTISTGFGSVVGTPQYMSPEQATLNNLDIDTRSDVYSLGVLLYELLAGSPPFARHELEAKGLMEILRLVREEEPPKPSTKLSTAAAVATLSANRGTEPRKLTALLRSELDWIVLKALEKDRSRRYDSSSAFALDIQRYLAGEPVAAHPPSAAYRLRKFLRKHKGGVAAGTAVSAALAGGLVGTSWQAIRAEREADRARQEELKTRDALQFADRNRQLAQVTLARSYLRPLGYNASGLDPAELFAMSELSVLSGAMLQESTLSGDVHGDPVAMAENAEDEMKLLCLTEALGNPETAERASRRAERFMQAVVGASAKRRAEALRILAAKQRDRNLDARIRTAACWLAMELRSDDLPAFEECIARLTKDDFGGASAFSPAPIWALIGTLGRAPLTPDQLARAVISLCHVLPLIVSTSYVPIGPEWATLVGRLGPTVLEQVLQSFFARVEEVANEEAQERARDVIRLLLPKLGNGLSDLTAKRIADQALQFIENSKGAMDERINRTRAFYDELVRSIAPSLGSAAAQRYADQLVASIAGTNHHDYPVRVLAAIAPRIDGATANRLTRVLIESIGKSSDESKSAEIAQAIESLAPKLDEPMAEARANTLVDLISVHKNNSQMRAVSKGLTAISPNLRAVIADKLALRLVAVIPTLSDGDQVRAAAQGVRSLAARRPREVGSRYRQLAVTALSKDAPRPKSHYHQFGVAEALVELSDPGTVVEVTKSAGDLADAIVAQLVKPPHRPSPTGPGGAVAFNESDPTWGTSALLVLVPHLDRASAGRIADQVSANLPPLTELNLRWLFVDLLIALHPRLNSASAVRCETVVRDELVRIVASSDPDFRRFIDFAASCTTQSANILAESLFAEILKARPASGNVQSATRECFAALALRIDRAAARRIADGFLANDSPLANSWLNTTCVSLHRIAHLFDRATASRVAMGLVTRTKSTRFDPPVAEFLSDNVANLENSRSIAEALLAMAGEPNQVVTPALLESLRALSPQLDRGTAQRGIDLLVARFASTTDPAGSDDFAQTIDSLGQRLDQEGRTRAYAKLAEAAPKQQQSFQLSSAMKCWSSLDATRFEKEKRALAIDGLRWHFRESASNSSPSASFGAFARHLQDWRDYTEFLTYAGCVDTTRDALLHRLEELLVRPRQAEPFVALSAVVPAGLVPLAAASECTWQHARQFRTVGDAVSFIANTHPEHKFRRGPILPMGR